MENNLKGNLLNKIKEVMKDSKRAIVCERQLQLDLAWALKNLYGDEAKIYLEYAVKDQVAGNHSYYDIVIETNDEFIPIELKFKTKAVEGCEYSNQSAQDLGRFDFWFDVERIQNFGIKSGKNFKKGYAILVTNDPLYWRRNGMGCLYEQFSTEDKRQLSAGDVLKWRDGYKEATVGIKRSREITIKNTYELIWDDVTSREGIAQFRTLILEVK